MNRRSSRGCEFAAGVAVILIFALAGISTAAGNFVTIRIPGAISTSANGISASGEIVGEATIDGAPTSFLLDAQHHLTTFNPPGSLGSAALGINNLGQIVGWFDPSPPSFQLGYLRSTDGTFLTYNLGDKNTYANGINNNGEVVGTAQAGFFGSFGFVIKSDGTSSNVDVPDALIVGANGINDSGEVVGTYISNSGVGGAYLLNVDGSVSTLATPSGFDTVNPLGINNRGMIVGSYSSSSDGSIHGFVLYNGVYTTADAPNSLSTSVDGIAPSGRIVGSYVPAQTPSITLGFAMRCPICPH